MPRGSSEAPPPSDAVGSKAMEAASRSALLVRCGGRSSAGLLLGGGGGGAWRGAFVLAPGLLLFGADVEDVTDVARASARVPPISVVMRRGRTKSTAVSTISSGCGVTSAMTSARAAGDPPPHPDDLAEVAAKLVAAWRWPALAKALPHVLAELRVEDDKQGDKQAARQVRDLLSVFVVLQLQPAAADAGSLRDALLRAVRRAPGVPPRGAGVLTSSAPLGAAALLGAVCRGVVAGTAPGGLLTLTDARVAPGSEGAGVFAQDADDDAADDDALPFGVVFSPLTWWRGEAVGFTLCVGLRRLLQDALRHLDGQPGQHDAPLAEEADQYGLDRSVLLVRCAHMWGTGLVVDTRQRVVLTCAHVLAEDEPVTVFWRGHSAQAAVLWRSADGVPYDVAVLQLADDACVAELEALALDTRPPRVGEPVLAAGYPLFSERCGAEHRVVRPVVSRGEVSGWWRSSASQILSTCCVQSGASGGPLLRLGPGRPTAIGVLVCNAQLGCGRDAVVYPHVNFALWVDTLAGPLNEFLASGDATALAGLQCDSAAVQRQWKLQPPRMCKL